ncbi:galactose mutarotase [Drosophila grimshawi]|uniref:Aldose 1-epimerase n=1 Tax=Drosophila grimshawi TaxID=7222 RepID=B4JLA6_DROGR|nr:galactose mutarotase [Drosophila grimshawi]EDW00359.1 GH11905 [Drosophila grimshawi]
MVKVVEDIFGIAINPFTERAQVVRRYTISNSSHLSVAIIQLGASIQSIKCPDAYHNVDDVVLGFDDIAGYEANRELKFGCMLGRVADRVANGEFVMDRRKVRVSQNFKNQHQIDGGFIGFDRIIWDLHMLRPDGITLRHTSADGHEGYPGNLIVLLHFTMDDDNRFHIRIEARTDQPTPVNISNHCYFNMAGQKLGRKGLLEHRLVIAAEHTIETGSESMPTGRFSPVDNTVYDMRVPAFIGDRLRQFENNPITAGFDVCYAIDKDFDANILHFVGRFLHPESGRFLDIHSNQPGMRFTTANNFPNDSHDEEPIMGKECARYCQYSGFSVQMEKFPDTMNNLDFPTALIMPSELYFHETIYTFGVHESWQCCATTEELEEIGEHIVRYT